MHLRGPKPGDIVTVTTRYPNDYYYATEKWREFTYENVPVLEPPRKLKSEEFAIPCTGEKYITYRVINMKYVKDLEILGQDTEEIQQSVRTVQIEGSRGNAYSVTVENGVPKSCTCPGFQFRRQCRHLKEAVDP